MMGRDAQSSDASRFLQSRVRNCGGAAASGPAPRRAARAYACVDALPRGARAAPRLAAGGHQLAVRAVADEDGGLHRPQEDAAVDAVVDRHRRGAVQQPQVAVVAAVDDELLRARGRCRPRGRASATTRSGGGGGTGQRRRAWPSTWPGSFTFVSPFSPIHEKSLMSGFFCCSPPGATVRRAVGIFWGSWYQHRPCLPDWHFFHGRLALHLLRRA